MTSKTAVKRAVIGTLLFLVGVSAFGQLLDQPVAVVRLTETVNIGQRELRQQVELLERQLGRTLNQDNRRELLDAQIAEVLLNQAAERKRIRVTQEDVDQAIAQQRAALGQPVSDAQFRQLVVRESGVAWEEYVQQVRERLIQERYIIEEKRSVIQNVTPPTEAEIRRFYEENATQFANPAMVRFSHLYIDTRNLSNQEKQERRERAEALYRRIQSGAATFSGLLDESLDDATFSGGDFGYLLRQDSQSQRLLGTSFIDAVFEVEEGQVSEGVLESNVGYHIVRITNKRRARILELSDPVLPGQNTTVRDQIRNFILSNRQQQAFQRAIQEVVDDLRDEAEITIFEQNLNW